MSTNVLTTSGYVAALQCRRRLWLSAHAPERGVARDPADERLLEGAGAIEFAARALFPGDAVAAPPSFDAAVARTREWIEQARVPAIFDAAFERDRVRVRADVVERLPAGGFRLVGVEAATEVSEDHHDGLVIQLHVLRESGLDVRAVEVVHVNGAYERRAGEVEPSRLFVRSDVTADVEFLMEDLAKQVPDFAGLLDSSEEPRVEPSPHCRRPHPCPFLASCRAGEPDDWIGDLPRMRTAQFHALRALGARRISELPADAPLDDRQRRAVEAYGRADGVATAPDLARRLARAGPPSAYLDFETCSPGIPVFEGTRPYQVIPFQWSLHRLDAAGALEHREFLAEGRADPRPEFAARLVEALSGDDAPVLVYSGFEAAVLADLETALPDLAEGLAALRARLFDLLPVVRGGVYARAFAGSFGLKRVSSALVPGFGYDDLESVRNGGDAALALTRLLGGNVREEERAELRAALLRYCARDTEALVEVHRVLRELAA
ncbi:MAG: DUF2779 domain-containing protein [Deltaproteobacteria bacterium]|nr:DUF2779 domain-containing protein [Deltaproteobacteria bacterium]MBW2413426.1 DUF2779 domain-containing protein [Deltaproteobacteria bacterium]